MYLKRKKTGAGILLYKRDPELKVFLVHPGGPYGAGKDKNMWSIPKGRIEDGEDPFEAAKREFTEETGCKPMGPFIYLGGHYGPCRHPGSCPIHIWACQQDFDKNSLVSNTFSMEWPKGSGNIREFPEVDRGDWFTLDEAREKLALNQAGFLPSLASLVLTGNS